MNILVVDHSKVFRTMWNRAVLPLGHHSTLAASGAEGLEVLRSRRPDLICTALSLTDMDGIEFCRRLRRLPHYRNTPVIALSATEDQSVRQRCFEAGFTDIHNKTDVQGLVTLIERVSAEQNVQISGRVLYIEDSSVVAHVMLKILDEMQLEVDHFTNASEALEQFQNHDYDLIISDILVEGQMSGMGLVNSIRSLPSDKSRVPILAVSGMDDTARRIELFKRGANDFISKPMVKEEVIARVTNLITTKQLFDQVKDQQAHLYELAMKDQLTGLYNRNALDEFAGKTLAEARRHTLHVSFIMLDIDHFKMINDRHGHAVGDTVLEQVGALLREACRTEDFAARLGGEEFLVILKHCDLKAATAKAEALRRALEALEPADMPVTASFGVTSQPAGRTLSFDTLLNTADQALYNAKHNGRNQVKSRMPTT